MLQRRVSQMQVIWTESQYYRIENQITNRMLNYQKNRPHTKTRRSAYNQIDFIFT